VFKDVITLSYVFSELYTDYTCLSLKIFVKEVYIYRTVW